MAKVLMLWKKGRWIYCQHYQERLYGFGIIDISEMIMSIEHAINYAEGYRFLLLCFGNEGSSDKAKMIMKGLEDYLQIVKDVYRFKVDEKKKRENFLKGVNA